MDGTHACHSSAVYAVLLPREIVTQFGFSTSLDKCSELACRFLQPFSSEDTPVEVLTSVDNLDVSVRWLQFHLFKCLYHFCYSILTDK